MNQKLVKIICRVLAAALALILLLGLIGPAFAAEEESAPSYVALGDSMSNGYGLNGYYLTLHPEDGSECTDEGCEREHEEYGVNGFLQGDTLSWPALFAAEKGFALTQLGMSGLRAEDVLYLLTYGSGNPSYADDYTLRAGVEGRFSDERLAKLPAMEGSTGVEAVARLYQDSVKEADVITLSLGYNNFGTFLTARLCWEISRMGFDLGGTYYETDLNTLLTQAGETDTAQAMEKLSGLVTTLEEKLADPEKDQSAYHLCKSLIDAGVYSYAGFLIGYQGILDYIARENPDAQVVVLGLGNSMEGVKLAVEGREIDLGGFFGSLIGAANRQLEKLTGEYPELSLCYVAHSEPELMVSRIAAGDFAGNDVLRQRILEKCRDMLLPQLGLELDPTLEQLEKTEAALAAGEGLEELEALLAVTAALSELPFDPTDAVLYLGVEQAVTNAAALSSIDSAAFSALMEEGGVEQAFAGVEAAREEYKTTALADREALLAAAAELREDEAARLAASLMVTPDAMAQAMGGDTIQALLHLMARFLIGDGIGCHPSAAGHETVYNALSEGYEDAFNPESAIPAEIRSRVEQAVIGNGLTIPEEYRIGTMITNFVAAPSSTYVAVGGASAYGDDSYVPLVAEALGVSYTNLTAKNMQTATQTMAILWANEETLAAADFITLGCQTSIAVESILGFSAENGRGLGDLSSTERVISAIEAYADGISAYAARLDDILERLRETNSDAAVIIVGMYDPLKDVTVTLDGTAVELGGLLRPLVEAVNTHAYSLCQETKLATYVDAPDVQTACAAEGTPVALDASQLLTSLYRDGSRLDPSPEGHAYIRDRIVADILGVYRLAGSTRFDTALKAADALKANLDLEKFENIIIASGTGFADALSGSYLAAVKQAPILLSYTTEWNRKAVDYVKENLAENGTVYILGGTAAVPEELEVMLEGYQLVRLAGENRFGTNLAVLREAGAGEGELLVCTGTGFADSLSASAVGLPILLVHDSLYEDQEAYLTGLEETAITVIGGEAAVSQELEETLAAYGTVERVFGENRVETSVAIARRYFDSPKVMVLAGAAGYPDGLCGSVLAYSMEGPLLLTMSGYGKTVAAYAEENGIRDGIVLGGRNAVTNAAAKAAFGLGASVTIPMK